MADFEYDDSTFYSSRPLEERWPPLGAAVDNIPESGAKHSDFHRKSDHERLQDLEDEQEELNGSLLALTNHFAQVQFRLKQVVASPPETRERLLMELEEFAFQGCPDVRGPKSQKDSRGTSADETTAGSSLEEYERELNLEKKKQASLIGQLKDQLEEMEKCVGMGATANVNEELNPEKLVEKQRIVIEELKTKMGLDFEGIEKLSIDDVRKNVSNAIGELMHPVKTKEELVKQLTTQIADLERFVTFLQGEVENAEERTERARSCPCSVHAAARKSQKDRKGRGKGRSKSNVSSSDSLNNTEYRCDYSLRDDLSDNGVDVCCLHVPPIPDTPEQVHSKRIREASLAIIKRALAILQIFAISQFGCTGKQIQDQIISKATNVAVPGYYEYLAQLQQSVLKVIDIKSREPPSEGEGSEPNSPQSPTSVQKRGRIRTSSVSSVETLSESSDRFDYARDAELVNVIRKDLAMALKALFQHGLVRVVDNRLISSRSLVACIVPTTRSSLPKRMHVWELFNDYYNMKHGREYNSTPARKLSEAFGIEVEGSNTTVTSKQSLLRTLHRIKTTHEPCRRSMDAMFKSLVCAGINQNRLSFWCRLISKTPSLVEKHYQSWSYVIKTGMDEALQHLERLNEYHFHIPEDLAIRHLTKINDAFGETY